MNIRARINAADHANREHMRGRFAACSGPCNQGRGICPTPEACRVPSDSLDDVTASACFWGVLAICLVIFDYIVAGGLGMLWDVVRGALA